jgi:hypothetical protein
MDTACRTPFFFLQKIIFFLKKHLTNEKVSATIFTSYHSNRRLSGNQYPLFGVYRELSVGARQSQRCGEFLPLAVG